MQVFMGQYESNFSGIASLLGETKYEQLLISWKKQNQLTRYLMFINLYIYHYLASIHVPL